MARLSKTALTGRPNFTVLKWKPKGLQQRLPMKKSMQDKPNSDESIPGATDNRSKHEKRHEIERGAAADFASDMCNYFTLTKDIDNEFFNPFEYRRSEDSSSLVKGALHTSMTSGWASLVPIKSADGKYPIVRTFLELMHADEANHYTYVYCGAIHRTVMQDGPQALDNLLPVVLQVKHKTYRRLQDRIDGLKGRPASDAVLSIILSLAVHDVNYEALSLVEPPYAKSPLSQYQLLLGVGFMRPQVTHFLALYRLVAQRGGIHQIKTFGIAHTLALADLIRATVTATLPVFDCLWSSISPIDQGTKIDMRAVKLSSGFGSRITNLAGLSPSLVPFIELVPALRDVTVLVDMYHRTKEQEPDTGDLVMFANSVQYRILCLGHSSKPESVSDVAAQTLKLFRLAALLYSDLVIFPLGYASGVRFGRAKDIYSVMIHEASYRIYEPHLEMWVLCMGFFGCLPDRTKTIEGTWLGAKLKNMIDFTCARGQNKKQFVEIMRGFIWWDFVCKDYIEDLFKNLYPIEAAAQEPRRCKTPCEELG